MRKVKQTVAAVLMVGCVLGGAVTQAQPAAAAIKYCYPNCPR
jgi:hypothetical protein